MKKEKVENLKNPKYAGVLLFVAIAVFVFVLAKSFGTRQKVMPALDVGRLADLHIPPNQITAEAVMAEISAAQPYEVSRQVARFYENADVDWTLPLATVDKQAGGMSRLTFQSSSNHASGIVTITVPTKNLDGLTILRSNSLVRIRGTIARADDGAVILTNASVVQSSVVASN